MIDFLFHCLPNRIIHHGRSSTSWLPIQTSTVDYVRTPFVVNQNQITNQPRFGQSSTWQPAISHYFSTNHPRITNALTYVFLTTHIKKLSYKKRPINHVLHFLWSRELEKLSVSFRHRNTPRRCLLRSSHGTISPRFYIWSPIPRSCPLNRRGWLLPMVTKPRWPFKCSSDRTIRRMHDTR